MKVYLAGPMTGIEDFNFPKFMRIAAELKAMGHEVFNPAQNDLDKWGDMEGVKKNANYRECLYDDLTYITKHAEAIYMMNGWEKSSGARAEHATALAVGCQFMYEPLNG